ncbi:MAG: cytochrome c-type biogenesis protein [Caulobacteraceae bacterium]
MRPVRLLLAVGAAILCMGATAADPEARLKDPAQEARARSLFRQIRCLVCQNESIDDSDADLADDLRKLVRTQVSQGRTDAEVRKYLSDRYGDFVLLNPRFSPGNVILWVGPFAVVLIGVAGAILIRRRETETEPLSSDEEARILALAGGEPGAADTLPPHPRSTDGAGGETKRA